MKPISHPQSSGHRRQQKGFALIVTLSLMILLTVIAVGLLSLSSITLRSAAQGNAMATAKANARLALMVALGELQKNAGPDQRVTARADLIDENIASPRLTGVWNSWEIKSSTTASEYDKATRDAKFRGWLVSGEPLKTKDIGFASQAPLAVTATGNKSAPGVTLWGSGTLGTNPFSKSVVTVNKVALTTPPGAMAWAVMDEGVKVRINTPYTETAASVGQKIAQLGSGQSPNVASMPGADPKNDKDARPLSGLTRTLYKEGSPQFANLQKGVTRLNFSLAGDQVATGVADRLKPLFHDISIASVGLLTDTARGGLKQDMQLMMGASTMPSIYASQGVYASRGITPNKELSDPSWESLRQIARLHSDKAKLVNSGGIPVIKASAPAGWVAASKSGTPAVTVVNKTPPAGVVLMPNLAKVQILFSLIGRDMYDYPWNGKDYPPPAVPTTAANLHAPQDAWFRGTKYHYDLHLLYTPIVTLHNPYNVAIEFTDVKMEFRRVPFAMQIFRNGQPQSNGMVPLEKMYGKNKDGKKDKVFAMTLKTKTAGGNPGATLVRLLPGEVKMFSAHVTPTLNYNSEVRQYGSASAWDADFDQNLTANLNGIPGWRGNGLGFDADQLAGDQAIDGVAANGHWNSSIAFARDDQLYVDFAPLSTPEANNKFTVQMTARVGTGAPSIVNAIEVDFENSVGLQDSMLGKGNKLRFPKDPGDTLPAISLVDHSRTAYSALKGVKPFALLSLQAKSTSGRRDGAILDGRNATKPWAFAHASIGASSQKVISEHAANHSHELDLQVLDDTGTNTLFDLDPQDRTNFISGHRALYGTKFGAQYEIPLAPLQSMPGLNAANPGGSSGYLPRFAQPIGNSWAHPLLSPDKMMQPGIGTTYLDHSFLLNLALFDGFYFSGLGSQEGTFGSGTKTESLATDFTVGIPLSDPRLKFRQPNGAAISEFIAEAPKDTAYSKVAAWQLMNGAFNVNSTSVAAWKAMLGSIRDSQAMYNQVAKGTITVAGSSKLANIDAPGADESRISRFRLPAALSSKKNPEEADGYWLGPREYSDAQLQTLAENIVKQVRLRGPFLSMAEFVNRRLGSESDEKAQRGALQQAIDDSNLNRAVAETIDVNAGYDIPASFVADYKYANKTAGAGLSYQGAPGYLTQADLMGVLGNAATARSDTFTIRGFGEARDTTGRMIASATCEAVVQRYPEWVDPSDAVNVAPASLSSTSNKNFGRRFVIISFRWLASSEV